jgi:hypothetical protein
MRTLSLDLMGRKVVASGGSYYRQLSEGINAFLAGAEASLAEFTAPLKVAVHAQSASALSCMLRAHLRAG